MSDTGGQKDRSQGQKHGSHSIQGHNRQHPKQVWPGLTGEDYQWWQWCPWRQRISCPRSDNWTSRQLSTQDRLHWTWRRAGYSQIQIKMQWHFKKSICWRRWNCKYEGLSFFTFSISALSPEITSELSLHFLHLWTIGQKSMGMGITGTANILRKVPPINQVGEQSKTWARSHSLSTDIFIQFGWEGEHYYQTQAVSSLMSNPGKASCLPACWNTFYVLTYIQWSRELC